MFDRDGGVEALKGEIKHLEMASRAFDAPPNGLLTMFGKSFSIRALAGGHCVYGTWASKAKKKALYLFVCLF